MLQRYRVNHEGRLEGVQRVAGEIILLEEGNGRLLVVRGLLERVSDNPGDDGAAPARAPRGRKPRGAADLETKLDPLQGIQIEDAPRGGEPS